MNLLRVPENTVGRDFFVGDIHGCFDRLLQLLRQADFDMAADRLFTCGDMVDRGPDSLAALRWMDLDWFFSTRGNHEQMAINFAAGHNHAFQYERNGGRWFIDLPLSRQHAIAAAFADLPLAIELPCAGKRLGIVHAEVLDDRWDVFEDPSVSVTEVRHWALWARERIERRLEPEVAGIDMVLVGHTPVLRMGLQLGNVVYTDTGAVFGNPMRLWCLTTGDSWVEQP